MFGRHSGLFAIAAYAIVLLVLGISARLGYIYYQPSGVSPATTVG